MEMRPQLTTEDAMPRFIQYLGVARHPTEGCLMLQLHEKVDPPHGESRWTWVRNRRYPDTEDGMAEACEHIREQNADRSFTHPEITHPEDLPRWARNAA